MTHAALLLLATLAAAADPLVLPEAAVVRTSGLADLEFQACMIGSFGTLRFAQPEGGGIVNVTYPFTFTPG
jgi:hypothetical protein